MSKKETEIIVEDDELEDGSIFVCFMCEKEFSKVSALKEHMQCHQNMPELSKDLPSRRRGRGRGTCNNSSSRGLSRGRGGGRSQGQGKRSTVTMPMEIKKEEPDTNEVVYIKDKPQNNKDYSSMMKAQRIRHYIQSRLMNSEKDVQKRPASFEEEGNYGLGVQLGEDEIMMVPSHSKKSVPAVLKAEPDGFFVPPQKSSAPSAKKIKLRKKLIVQEVVYEEVEVDEDEDDSMELPPTIERIPPPSQTKAQRGRPKKSQKVVTPKEEEDEDEEEEMIEVKMIS
ncbi:hypothetical protein SK128_021661 [Halocaridina rubra]|uniref:C2H2-type domain-containing protein n=1 Tax=Halocaridina rubra TaxID=373956 RepID=A0AAN8XDT5_HALRR